MRFRLIKRETGAPRRLPAPPPGCRSGGGPSGHLAGEDVAQRKMPCRHSSNVTPFPAKQAFTTKSPQRKR